MKTSTLTLAILFSGLLVTSQLFISCGGKKADAEESIEMTADSTRSDEMKMDSTAMAYACPMHPEVTGKEGDACSKCGMKLDPVKGEDSTKHAH